MSVNVCHLIDANVDTGYFRGLARLHDRASFPIALGSLAPAGPLQQAMANLGVTTFGLGACSRLGYAAALGRLVALLREQRTQILHAHCFDPTWVGLVAARRAGIRFVFTRHHSDHHLRLGKRWHTRVDAWCARRADHVIAVSEATRTILRDVERVPEQKVSVVYNGVEPFPDPSSEAVDAARRALAIGGEPVLLMPARLHEEKGHRFLLEALPAVIERCGPLTLLLAGDGPHRAAIEGEVRRWRLEERVRFLGRRDDMPVLFAVASVVVLPSLAESFGLVVIEAMGLGKPVVAARTGGIPELIADGRTGWLVPPADADALASALVQVLQHPDAAASVARAGRASAEGFGLERMVRGYEAVYDRVLSAPAGRVSRA
jgi:glycosyltransferase involved in cell wall biosynthesis